LAGAAGPHRLVLVGGGNAPDAAVARFVQWGGGKQAHILVIPWASAEEKAAFVDWRPAFAAYGPASIECAELREYLPDQAPAFLAQLKNATAVFFAGGDQNRIMDVLADTTLWQALRQRFADGAVFGGTSAGTAIMSRWMMTGNDTLSAIGVTAVKMRPGLGLLPPDVIVDTHFIRRQRENRLFSALLILPGSQGLAIDEGMAISVEDDRLVEVFGPTQLMLMQRETLAKRFIVDLLGQGERYDLELRRAVFN
jgi:cyanophycinase